MCNIFLRSSAPTPTGILLNTERASAGSTSVSVIYKEYSAEKKIEGLMGLGNGEKIYNEEYRQLTSHARP